MPPRANALRPASCSPPPAKRRASESPSSASQVLVDDHAAHVLAVEHVLVGLADLIELVSGGDELVELEMPGPVDLEDPRDVDQGVAAAEEGALDPSREADEQAGVDLDGDLG